MVSTKVDRHMDTALIDIQEAIMGPVLYEIHAFSYHETNPTQILPVIPIEGREGKQVGDEPLLCIDNENEK